MFQLPILSCAVCVSRKSENEMHAVNIRDSIMCRKCVEWMREDWCQGSFVNAKNTSSAGHLTHQEERKIVFHPLHTTWITLHL